MRNVLIAATVFSWAASYASAQKLSGGWGGIRTHEGLAPLPDFKSGAFNRSATHPRVRSAHTAPEPVPILLV